MQWVNCMALADSVPGVSGGPLRFCFWFAMNLSILKWFNGAWQQKRKKAFPFSGKAGIWAGLHWLACPFNFAKFTTEAHIYQISLCSFTTLFAIPMVIKEEVMYKRHIYLENLVLLFWAQLWLAYWFNPSGGEGNVSADHFHSALGIYIFVAMIA